MSMDGDSTCCLCIIAPVLLLLVFVLCCVSTNNVCSYYIKMTALYLTIMMNAIVCAIICTPIRFFGDVGSIYSFSFVEYLYIFQSMLYVA